MICSKGFDQEVRHSHTREIVVERVSGRHVVAVAVVVSISDQSGILAAVRYHDMATDTRRVVQQMDIGNVLEAIEAFRESDR